MHTFLSPRFQKGVLAGREIHGVIDMVTIKDGQDHAEWLHPANGEALPAGRQQAEAALILPGHSHRTSTVKRNGAFQSLLTGRLKFRDGDEALLYA